MKRNDDIIVWMMVSQDKYRLPEAIANSVSELSRITGHNMNTISSLASKHEKGIIRNSRFIKVHIEKEDYD